ncbi:MAG TPA: hypothetical protein VGW32_02420, partial [Pyrinomonadaceae bacterium]|nr:hypothetical protein [Pyrinomonadaceae bacterium]
SPVCLPPRRRIDVPMRALHKKSAKPNKSEPEADRGPRAGSPRGVVDATGFISRQVAIIITGSLPLPVLTPLITRAKLEKR